MLVDRLDHLVLTVKDVEASCGFYTAVLGMETVEFSGGRKALAFGSQKINLHQAGSEFAPHAERPVPGSADLCFITSLPLERVMHHLVEQRVVVIAGPVRRTGAQGPICSVYFRDPDGNLIELANQHPLSFQDQNDAA